MKLFVYSIALVLLFSFAASGNADSLQTRAKELDNSVELADTYIQLISIYTNAHYDSALVWIDRSELLCRDLEYKKGWFETLRKKGEVLYHLQRSDSALKVLDQIYVLKLLETPLDSADLLNQRGVTLQQMGKLDLALDELNKALSIYNRIDSKSGLLAILVNMGNCFYEAGRTQESLNYFKEAYELAIDLEDEKNLPITALNYAMLSLYVEADTAKVDALLNSLEQNEFVKKNPDVLSALNQNLAVYFSQVSQFKRAETNYLKALEIMQANGMKASPGIYSGLAQIYMKQGNFKKAIPQFHEARNHSTKNSDLRLIYHDLARIYTEFENIDSAAYYWDLNWKIQTALEQEKTQELILKSKNNLDFIKKENEIKLLEAKRKTEELKNQFNVIVIFSLAALIALIAALSYFIIKQKKKQITIQEQDLKLKNQKLTSLSLHINQKNQILKDFESIASKKADSESGFYRDIKFALKASLKIDEDWKDFERYFNDLHTGFYDQLKKQFPDLTNNELRICSLAKLRFTLKEISQTLNISIDSVKSARYRLRKKLNLETNQDLSDFLNRLTN